MTEDSQKEWIYQLIEKFRKIIVNPPEIKCLDQLLNYDLRAPVQLTILWLKNYTNDFQLIIIFHNPKFLDKLVNIIGPYNIHTEENMNINQIIKGVFKYAEDVNEALKLKLSHIIRENMNLLNEKHISPIFNYGLIENKYFYFLLKKNIK